jgi:hypothetical protein
MPTGPWISGRNLQYQPLTSMAQWKGVRRTTDPWISGRKQSASDLRGTVDRNIQTPGPKVSSPNRSKEENRPLDLRNDILQFLNVILLKYILKFIF